MQIFWLWSNFGQIPYIHLQHHSPTIFYEKSSYNLYDAKEWITKCNSSFFSSGAWKSRQINCTMQFCDNFLSDYNVPLLLPFFFFLFFDWRIPYGIGYIKKANFLILQDFRAKIPLIIGNDEVLTRLVIGTKNVFSFFANNKYINKMIKDNFFFWGTKKYVAAVNSV